MQPLYKRFQNDPFRLFFSLQHLSVGENGNIHVTNKLHDLLLKLLLKLLLME